MGLCRVPWASAGLEARPGSERRRPVPSTGQYTVTVLPAHSGLRPPFTTRPSASTLEERIRKGCLVQVGNGIELEAVGLHFEPYRWRPCGVTWDSSRTVVVIKLRRTSALRLSPSLASALGRATRLIKKKNGIDSFYIKRKCFQA